MELLHRQNTWRLEAHEVARPLHVPEKEPGHGMFTALPICFIMTISLYICISLTWFCLVVFAQAIQEVFVVEEWVKDARNDARVEANLRAETNKALGTFEQKNKELNSKLVAEERAHLSAEVGLKNARDQAEDQRKRLYHTKIELTTTRQQVLKLSADLEKTKAVTQMAEEAAEASKQASQL